MEQKKPKTERVSIDELERLLNAEDDQSFEILPNGTVKRLGKRRRVKKPLTMRQNLGGEYAA